jgi:zinc/manganese transport system substrate-binding protein
MKILFRFLLTIWAMPLFARELPKVVTLHPLLTEWVGDLLGDAATVKGVMPPNSNVHSFEPTPRDLIEMQDAVLVVAMGKHLESYLDRLRANLPAGVEIYEAGRLVPSLKSDPETAMFACCPVHGLAAIDPHWWQSPVAVRRAVRHLGRELEKTFPDQKDDIRERTTVKMQRLEDLNKWTEKTLSVIPAADRKLVTTHNAFGYFCAQYRFQAVPVKGVTNERDPTPEELAATMAIMTKEKVKALFPESNASGDFLKSVHEASGIPLSAPISADFGLAEGERYEDVFKQNVLTMVKALSPQVNE